MVVVVVAVVMSWIPFDLQHRLLMGVVVVHLEEVEGALGRQVA